MMGPTELPADVRGMAAATFGIFIAYCQAGFTPAQALYLTGMVAGGKSDPPAGVTDQ